MASHDYAAVRTAGAALILALGLSGCASTGPQTAGGPSAGDQAALAIDPSDPLAPWVPHIREASERFDVPEKWIRAVMLRESGGRSVVNGRVITSSAGAIGLMQVMPGTYALMRDQYGLGRDPSDPHDNIMAGTAYLRQMYDLFGAPGFLAAYNCGPACYASHLAGKQRLPRETKLYLAALTPVLRGVGPREPSQSAGASAIEVAVVPDSKPIPPSLPSRQAPAPSPAPAPVAVASLDIVPVPVPKPEVAPAPRAVAPQPEPVPARPPVEFVAVADRAAPRAATRTTAARGIETQVAEAILPANAAGRGERVVIRFVSQRSDGCGSLTGKNRMCVALGPDDNS